MPMRANLRVLAGTVLLALGAFLGIGAGQQAPQVAPPPAPAAAFVLDLSNGTANGGAIQFHFTADSAVDVSAAQQKLAAVHLAQLGTQPAPADMAIVQQKLAAVHAARAAENDLRAAQRMERLQAVREDGRLQTQSADQDYGGARGFRKWNGQYGGPAPSGGSGYQVKQFTAPAAWDNDGGSRRSVDNWGSRRAEVAQLVEATHAAAAEHFTLAQALTERAVAESGKPKLTPANPTAPPQAPHQPPPADGLAGYDEDARPVVYRAGKPAPGLPDWFVRLDTDFDGQVGLYEWKVSGRSLEEFGVIDRNGDGLITAEEMLWYLAHQPTTRPAGPTVATAVRQ
jgi:hypothetical protein